MNMVISHILQAKNKKEYVMILFFAPTISLGIVINYLLTILLYMISYFTTFIVTIPSAKKEILSAAKSVYIVAESTCSPSFTKTSTLKWSKISLSFISPASFFTKLRRWWIIALLEPENFLSILSVDSYGRKLIEVWNFSFCAKRTANFR